MAKEGSEKRPDVRNMELAVTRVVRSSVEDKIEPMHDELDQGTGKVGSLYYGHEHGYVTFTLQFMAIRAKNIQNGSQGMLYNNYSPKWRSLVVLLPRPRSGEVYFQH